MLLSTSIIELQMTQELYKNNKLGLINKNINNFYKIKLPSDLDHNGSKLINGYYPNIWIDAYLDNDDDYYNSDFKIIINLNNNIKIKKINYLNNTFDRYEQWLNRFNMYNYEIDYINYSNNKHIVYNKELQQYYIIFTCFNLKQSIYTAIKLKNKINVLKKWIYKYITIYKMSIRNKNNMLYQFKCLPICVENEIQNMYENNLW